MSEITWSLMHPTNLSVEYMERVVREGTRYDFDSFEICGPFAAPYGGLNGLTMLERYPAAHRLCDCAKVAEQRAKLNRIVELAHSIGKKLYYWHREIMMPRGMLEECPDLLDERGEFNLTGKSFLDFLRYKIDEAFRNVPGLDGVVLTLTEADYSVIHNSRPDQYPPDRVVRTIVELFAEEHRRRGKRFILRSFGSIAQDYRDILKGAALAAEKYSFEIETKIVPYDFIPFLPPNPFLRALPNTALNAECDCLGEYLGAGYLPACSVSDIYRYVREGRENGVSRYAIRLDRIGNSIFDSSHEINLYAYTRFIRDPEATVEQVMQEYAAKHDVRCVKEMNELRYAGLECVKHINFIRRNVVFHKFPIQPDFKWIKAGGSFSLYRDGFDLHLQEDCWGIRSQEKTPGRKAILEEKALACKEARQGLEKLRTLKELLPEAEYRKQERSWRYAVKVSSAIEAYTRTVAAYFDEMDAMRETPEKLLRTLEESQKTISTLMADHAAPPPEVASCCEGAPLPGENLDAVYFAGLRFLCGELLNEYAAEYAARREMAGREEVVDFVIPGGLYDDVRTGRAMHASHSFLRNGRPVREVGNPVFPNGTIRMELKGTKNALVEILLDPDSAKELTVWLNGKKEVVSADGDRLRLRVNGAEKICCVIGKHGRRYPLVHAVAVLKE